MKELKIKQYGNNTEGHFRISGNKNLEKIYISALSYFPETCKIQNGNKKMQRIQKWQKMHGLINYLTMSINIYLVIYLEQSN